MLYSILFLVAAGLIIWWAVRIIKHNPGAFTKANFSKTATTVGLLTLLIIGIIFVAVMLLKTGAK